jgi:hypothetical protein
LHPHCSQPIKYGEINGFPQVWSLVPPARPFAGRDSSIEMEKATFILDAKKSQSVAARARQPQDDNQQS